jgi:YfiH family protein
MRLIILVMRRNGFVLREFQGVRYYSCSAFENLPHLRHGFSTRLGGSPNHKQCSFNLGMTSWDSEARVHENRHLFLSALKLEDAHLVTLHQIHSNRVHIIEDISGQWNRREGDALSTRLENVALAVQVADCLPILIADPVANAVAAVHSGWRGTLSRVLLRTIREMQRAFGSNPEDIRIAVGPGIQDCCFEVGAEVAALFRKEYPGDFLAKPAGNRPDKYFLDLCGALHAQMDLAGVPQKNRHNLGACTRCSAGEFFSYRAEGPTAGRMMAIIGLSRRAGD